MEDSILEFQTALVENETDEMERMLKIRATCERLKAAWNAPLAVPIPMIPKNPVWSEFEDLEEVDKACNERMALLCTAMAKQEGVTEALKADDQMEWVRRKNSIHNRAEEIVLRELIYTYED